MKINGIVFAGTATEHRAEMATFVRDVLGLTPETVDGVESDLFAVPDGSSFAVASPGGMGDTNQSLGFLVEDLDAAVDELRRHGTPADHEISSNARCRYIHFRAPDGRLYELVENITPS